jgi:hypothetical protein
MGILNKKIAQLKALIKTSNTSNDNASSVVDSDKREILTKIGLGGLGIGLAGGSLASTSVNKSGIHFNDGTSQGTALPSPSPADNGKYLGTDGSTVTWNTFDSGGGHRSLIPINASWYAAFNVSGDHLASIVKFSVTGTVMNVVFANRVEVIVQHYQDILIKSDSGYYTRLYVKITSNNNEDFTVWLKGDTWSGSTANCEVVVHPESREVIDFNPASTHSGTTLEHTCYRGSFKTGNNGGGTGNLDSGSIGVIKNNSTPDAINGDFWYDNNDHLLRVKIEGSWKELAGSMDGSSESRASSSAVQILQDNPASQNGVYWIDLPTVGPTQVYCDMSNGGWMLAMKATRGSTFQYSSSHWTTASTLSEGSNILNTNDSDGKSHVFNYYKGKDARAVFPDCGSFVWTQSLYGTMTLLDRVGSEYYIGDPWSSPNYDSRYWRSQAGMRWHGWNYANGTNGNSKIRWGFAWNNESQHSSNDVTGGIGLYHRGQNLSAGTAENCCCYHCSAPNRTHRFEFYVK